MKRGAKKAEALSPYYNLLVVFSCSLFFAPSKVSERLEEAFPHIKWPLPFQAKEKAPGTRLYNLQAAVNKHHNFVTTL